MYGKYLIADCSVQYECALSGPDNSTKFVQTANFTGCSIGSSCNGNGACICDPGYIRDGKLSEASGHPR